MFEQLCQQTIIQLTIAHLLTHQLHNRSHTFVTRDSAGITWHTRNCKIRNKTSIYSASHQCAFTIYHETTLYSYYLKSIGVRWVGWKSKKVSRYFCTAPPRNVSLPRARSTPPRSCAPGAGPRTRVSRAWHLLQWMRRYKTTKWRLLVRQMREMWRLWRHMEGLHRI